jgi:putative membrane protein
VTVLAQVAGSLVLRPYVFGFLALYVVVAAAKWGWRRAAAFTLWAAGLAFAAEWSSTRVGFPFGLYHYTGVTAGRELYVSNVPLFDPLSFSFLAFASLGMAERLLAWWDARRRAAGHPDGDAGTPGRRRMPSMAVRCGGRWRRPVRLAVATGVLMMWLDLVIDPLAVRGARWFLGRIFYYPEPGPYFGVPLANFAGWVVVGAGIALGWDALAPAVGGRPPAWAARLPGRRHHPVAIYYLVLGFNLAVTAAVAEPALLWSGVAVHAPLAALVVCSSKSAECRLATPGRARERA